MTQSAITTRFVMAAAMAAGLLSIDPVYAQDAVGGRPAQVDISSLPENAVTVYTQGSMAPVADDVLPLLSESSGYNEKWEFYLVGDEYSARLKFEISNFAFSKYEGKLKGYVRKKTGGEEVEYKISKSLKNGQWKADKSRLNLDFGDYQLSFDGQNYHLSGAWEKGTFEYTIPSRPWKPGTGNVYFGNSENNIFKYSLMTYNTKAAGTVVEDGKSTSVVADAYGNHYAATVAIYDMFDEVADFRKTFDGLHVEFRYYVPNGNKYNHAPFGYMFVAYRDVPLLSSIQLDRTALDTWLDDDNYGYEIDSRQRIVATDQANRATFEMLTARPEPSDPYANLPAFQRNIASRFAKPVEYSIKIQWELLLDIEGIKAKIPYQGSYSVTRMR